MVDLLKSEPSPHQVVIRVRTCGICKTDLTVHDGNFLAKSPLVSGHEFAGVVNSAGSAVTRWKVGDRVTADNAELCGYYEPCRNDKPLYYKNFNSHGYNTPGGFAEYMLVNHDKVLTLSDKLSFEEATFTEPTACTVHSMDRVASRFNNSILMLGTGPIGIILTQLLRRAGAGRMVIADSHAGELGILRKYGFTDLVIMGKTSPLKHTAETKAITPGSFDIVIDATGTASVFRSYFRFIRMGSKIMAYGVYAADAKIPVGPRDIFNREYIILGSFAQTRCFGRALEYLESNTVQVKELISHELPLEGYGKGLDYIARKQAHKVIIHP